MIRLIATCALVTILTSISTPLFGADLTDRNVNLRGSLTNSLIQFEREQTGHVAFMGGSITEMNGYRPMVCEWLKKRFPATEFTFTDAGISSTCSTTGAMRLTRDVLSKGPVDLFLVEFAVNDDQDAGHAQRECIRGMEGIVSQIRQHNPAADIIVVYFCNPGMIETLQQERTPLTIASHEAVAEHYEVPSVNLAREVATQISERKLTWKEYGGTHPKPAGNRVAADMVAMLLEQGWKTPLSDKAQMQPHPLPAKPIDTQSYANGRFIDPKAATIDELWRVDTPNWKALPGSCRARFVDEKVLHADESGAELALEFEGRAVGAYLLAGPDAGMIEVRVDDAEATKIDLYHRFSRGLHYPRTVMFTTGLADGKHTLHLRISDMHNEASKGHAVRILQFTAN